MAPREDDTLEAATHASLARIFGTNTFGPLLFTQALLANLRAAPRARVGMMSSRVGSVGDNTTGRLYAYRASKAALNSVARSLAMDLRDEGVVVVIMHPGFLRTGLDPGTHGVPEAVEPDEAAAKLCQWKVLMSMSIEDTGRFWHREGQELPW
jgi:NAD(P)-dependent dehydrogenase (short-subunit alcohol dehydrogenase family)